MVIQSTLESTYRDEGIKCASKWFILAVSSPQNGKSIVCQAQVRFLQITHLGPLKAMEVFVKTDWVCHNFNLVTPVGLQ